MANTAAVDVGKPWSILATTEGGADPSLVLSPALAVTVGRLLAGPDPRRVLQTALGST